MYTLDKIALVLVTIGALNWGSIGLFDFDVISSIFSDGAYFVARIIFTLVGLAGLWCLSLVFSSREKRAEAYHSMS